MKYEIRIMNMLPLSLCRSELKHVNPLHHNGIRIRKYAACKLYHKGLWCKNCITKGYGAKGRVPLYSSYLTHAHTHVHANIHAHAHRFFLSALLHIHRVVLLQVSLSLSSTSFQGSVKIVTVHVFQKNCHLLN